MMNRIGPRGCRLFCLARFLLFLTASSTFSWAATTGSISGILKDPSGAVVPGAMLIATNTAQGIQSKTTTDDKGFYIFPSLPVGRYDLQAQVEGFRSAKRTGLVIDADSALQIDLTVEMIEKIEEVTVIENGVQVETASTQMGRGGHGPRHDRGRSERAQFHGPAGSAAGHRADDDAAARFDRHGGRVRRDCSLGRA